ncbi:MAG: NHLP bacteriocin export ABC transporter permease/ATPase subunit [Desulfobacterales bacterium]|nr:NHLP bacteriocin export ABC transporter permease/ATPase subunit [Desulfobacterales bacterium]
MQSPVYESDIPVRLKLDDNAGLWKAVSKPVRIYALPVIESGLPRKPHTIFEAKPDQWFPDVFGASGERFEFFAEPAIGGSLQPVDLSIFQKETKQIQDKIINDIEELISEWMKLFGDEIPPHNVLKILNAGANIRLPANSKAGPKDSMIWILPESESVSFGKNLHLSHLEIGKWYALSRNQWIETKDKIRLTCINTEQLIKGGHFFNALCNLSIMTSYHLEEIYSKTEINLLGSSNRNMRHRKVSIDTSLNRIASVLCEVPSPSDSSIFKVFRRLCNELGLNCIKPDKLFENENLELEELLSQNLLFKRTVILKGDWWRQNSIPIICRIKEDGNSIPAALIPDNRKGYLLFHPETLGHIRVTKEIASKIEETGLQLYPSLPKVPKWSALKLFAEGVKYSRREWIWIGITAAIGGILGFAFPMAMSYIVEGVIIGAHTELLFQIMLLLIMTSLGGLSFELVKQFALMRLEAKAQLRLQSAVFSHMLRLSLDIFRKFTTGDLTDRVMSIDRLRQNISTNLLTTLISSVFALLNIFLMLFYSWKLALGIFTVGILFVTASALITKKQMKTQLQMQNVIGKMAGIELEIISGILKIRACGAEAEAFSRWGTVFSEVRKINYGIAKSEAVVSLTAQTLPALMTLTLFSLAVFLKVFENLGLGSFLAFNMAMGQLSAAMASIARTSYSLLFIAPIFARAKPLLEGKTEIHPGMLDPGELKGSIFIRNLYFRYAPDKPYVLQGVNIDIKPGEFVAVVGGSGSGKTSLLRLMLGLYPPSLGSIIYDGKDLSRIDKRRLRQQIGSVIQNGDLTQGNLFMNIVGNNPCATEESAWEAARLAALDKEIMEMPMKMQTFVPHGGGTFSGGQRQRILIARALANRPKIIFFDEATSALDNISQSLIMNNIESMQATRFVIAHRLSTIQKADRIYVMKNGKVAEFGTYEELLKKDGEFKKLVQRQMT